MPEDPAALHVVGVTGTGRLIHTTRTPGAWTPFVDVFGPAAADQPQLQGNVTEVAAARAVNLLGGAPAAPVFPEALIVAVLVSTQPRPLFFYRYADTGQWLPMGTVNAIAGTRRLAITCANGYPSVFGGPMFDPVARLHLAWIGAAGQLIVTSSPVVAPGVTGPVVDVEDSSGITRGAFRVPALAGFAASDQVTSAKLSGITADGHLYESIVKSDGGVEVLQDVETAGAGNAGELVDIALAVATRGDGLEYYGAVTGDRRVLLATRHPVTGTWTTWRNLEEADFAIIGNGVFIPYRDIFDFGTFERLALATTTEGLHVLGVSSNGHLFHQLQPSSVTHPSRGQEFRDVETIGVGADAGEFVAIAAA
ncbi:hypothetical protein [Virgisporangium aurantiacum]|uniref:Uncharacterized protein n=1 Tax=Virgisporangium aurantiacum TaxID=175570 RepID=A0A8J3ZL75_9ACTN|nr:hypothetical protein [Virgisporangium aurantiacum]GIJ64987.1 hypothetical protein Vau01_125030 [Virgisporangium aurantiacum]